MAETVNNGISPSPPAVARGRRSTPVRQGIIGLFGDLWRGRSSVDILTPDAWPRGFSASDRDHFQALLAAHRRLFDIPDNGETFSWVQTLLTHPKVLRQLADCGFLYGAFFVCHLETEKMVIPSTEYGPDSVRIPVAFPGLLRSRSLPSSDRIASRFLDMYDAFSTYCRVFGQHEQRTQAWHKLAQEMNRIPSVRKSCRESLARVLVPEELPSRPRVTHAERFQQIVKCLEARLTAAKGLDSGHYVVLILGHLINFMVLEFFDRASPPSGLPWSVRSFLNGMKAASWFEKQLQMIYNEPGEVAVGLLADLVGSNREDLLADYGFIAADGTPGPNAWAACGWIEKISRAFASEYRPTADYCFESPERLWERAAEFGGALERFKKDGRARGAPDELARVLVDFAGSLRCKRQGAGPVTRFHLSLQKVLKHRVMGDYGDGKKPLLRGYLFIPLSPVTRGQRELGMRAIYPWFTAASLNVFTPPARTSALSRGEELVRLQNRFEPLAIAMTLLETTVKDPFFREHFPKHLSAEARAEKTHFTLKSISGDLLSLCDLAERQSNEEDAAVLRWIVRKTEMARHTAALEGGESSHTGDQAFLVTAALERVVRDFSDCVNAGDLRSDIRARVANIQKEGGLPTPLSALEKLVVLDLDGAAASARGQMVGCEECFVAGWTELVRNAVEATLDALSSRPADSLGKVSLFAQQTPGEMVITVRNSPGTLLPGIQALFNNMMAGAMECRRGGLSHRDFCSRRDQAWESLNGALPKSEKHKRSGVLFYAVNAARYCGAADARFQSEADAVEFSMEITGGGE